MFYLVYMVDLFLCNFYFFFFSLYGKFRVCLGFFVFYRGYMVSLVSIYLFCINILFVLDRKRDKII